MARLGKAQLSGQSAAPVVFIGKEVGYALRGGVGGGDLGRALQRIVVVVVVVDVHLGRLFLACRRAHSRCLAWKRRHSSGLRAGRELGVGKVTPKQTGRAFSVALDGAPVVKISLRVVKIVGSARDRAGDGAGQRGHVEEGVLRLRLEAGDGRGAEARATQEG